MALELVERTAPKGEEELIAACIAGDQAAQRQLFRREYGRVYATIFRLLGSARDADDLVQETFIAVFRALSTFRGESKLSTWVDRIAVRIVFHHIRSRRPTISLEAVPEPASSVNMDAQVHAREGLRRLYATLARLTPDARAAFALYAIDGRSIADVATLTGTTSITAKVRIWRARREVTRRAAADPVLADYLHAHGKDAP